MKPYSDTQITSQSGIDCDIVPIRGYYSLFIMDEFFGNYDTVSEAIKNADEICNIISKPKGQAHKRRKGPGKKPKKSR